MDELQEEVPHDLAFVFAPKKLDCQLDLLTLKDLSAVYMSKIFD